VLSLTQFAQAGFRNLSTSREILGELGESISIDAEAILVATDRCADPDRALAWLVRLARISPASLTEVLAEAPSARRLMAVLGGSRGLAEFIERNPGTLGIFRENPEVPGDEASLVASLCASVGAVDGFSRDATEATKDALRVHYRELLLRIAIWDLCHPDPLHAIELVTGALSDIAGGALDAALCIARTEVAAGGNREDVALVELAIIAMGKCGARELNYLSDVDVIYAAASRDEVQLPTERALTLATRLAQVTSRTIGESGREPGLWEVDANLRPEGKDGALVRTVESHLAYYERWAKDWEFQALIKARPIAGSRPLGERYVHAVSPLVWSSASRPNFVEQVQRMRERVTAHIPADDVDFQIKLGPGGLRDVEFTVQLLQLVHGLVDPTVRRRGTLETLLPLADGGYVGRIEAATFAERYRFLRLLEHRVQLRELSRTHLMPRDADEQRALARATSMFSSAEEVVESWQQAKLEVRALHERLFYRPLLAAVATLPEETHQLTSDQAQARLAAIGFRDPRGALHHIAALTSGVSRRASILRTLVPVLLQWLAEGADPDNGLLTFRRVSEALGESPWFLRMLRDSAGAAQRLTTVLSGSRYVTDLLERIPESAAWFDNDEDLLPRTQEVLAAELDALLSRHLSEGDPEAARSAVLAVRRREVLRLAIAGIITRVAMTELSLGLYAITAATLDALLTIALSDEEHNPEFALVAMGRFGGQEMGFGSDADVMFVYRATGECSGEAAQHRAERIVARLTELADDVLLPLPIDTDLRPEGKNGAIVRSLESYEAYYERWSLLWEAQALLRAAPAAGHVLLLRDTMALIDSVRYGAHVSDDEKREIRRIKARVEGERLPQGADPARHVKLGRGSISDVEWLVQLVQLIHSPATPELRTTSTLDALAAAVEAGFVSSDDAARLSEAWILASRVRSAIVLWMNKATDLLPRDTADLDGIARLLGYAPGSSALLEERYLATTRRARAVFERVFFEL
jgi:glutamate-ammonia-ligase adenylyltransferase